MSANKPLKSLLALAKEDFKDKFTINEFMNTAREISSVPGLLEMIDEHLEGVYTTVLNRKTQGIGVPSGQFELQKHDISVEPHTDDVDVGLHFGMYVVDTELSSRGGTGFTKSPSFSYFDPIDNCKKEKILNPGSLVVFNPRKKHSVVYYGYSYTVMLFMVKKITKKGK